MKQDIKVGDRFKTGYENIIEVVNVVPKIKFVVVEMYGLEMEDYGKPGDVFYRITIPSAYSYLGNFSKSRNFNSLYEILS